jgi:hypothetical protein
LPFPLHAKSRDDELTRWAAENVAFGVSLWVVDSRERLYLSAI